MNKYLITVATELDGHAGAESYYVQTDGLLDARGALGVIFRQEMEEGLLSITHSRADSIYGDVYDFPFSLVITKLPSRMQKMKLYISDTRTG